MVGYRPNNMAVFGCLYRTRRCRDTRDYLLLCRVCSRARVCVNTRVLRPHPRRRTNETVKKRHGSAGSNQERTINI